MKHFRTFLPLMLMIVVRTMFIWWNTLDSVAGFVEGKAEEDSDILEDAKGTQAAELSCSKIVC